MTEKTKIENLEWAISEMCHHESDLEIRGDVHGAKAFPVLMKAARLHLQTLKSGVDEMPQPVQYSDGSPSREYEEWPHDKSAALEVNLDTMRVIPALKGWNADQASGFSTALDLLSGKRTVDELPDRTTPPVDGDKIREAWDHFNKLDRCYDGTLGYDHDGDDFVGVHEETIRTLLDNALTNSASGGK